MKCNVAKWRVQGRVVPISSKTGVCNCFQFRCNIVTSRAEVSSKQVHTWTHSAAQRLHATADRCSDVRGVRYGGGDGGVARYENM